MFREKNKVRIGGKFFESNILDLGNLSIHVVIGGQGQVIVLLHGWPGFWKDWEKVMPLLIDGFKVIVPDLRGFGLSSRPNSPSEYTLDHYARDVLEVLDELGIGEAIFCGFDIGSTVSAYFARRYRDRVSGLILLNPSYPGLGMKRLELKYAVESWYQYFHLLELAERLVGYNRDTVKIYLSHFYRHWAFRQEAFTEEDIEEYVDIFYMYGLRGGFNWYRARMATRYGDWLGGPLDVKCLILWSDRDPVFPLEWSDGVLKYFPNARLEVIKDCGHFVPREAPHELEQHIRRFANELGTVD